MAVWDMGTEVARGGLVARSHGATGPATVGVSASMARSTGRSTWWQRLVPICQALGAVAAVIALVKLARPLGALVQSAHLDVQWGTLAVASIVSMVSYAQLAQLSGPEPRVVGNIVGRRLARPRVAAGDARVLCRQPLSICAGHRVAVRQPGSNACGSWRVSTGSLSRCRHVAGGVADHERRAGPG